MSFPFVVTDEEQRYYAQLFNLYLVFRKCRPAALLQYVSNKSQPIIDYYIDRYDLYVFESSYTHDDGSVYIDFLVTKYKLDKYNII